MNNIRIQPNARLAESLRTVGLGRLVDSKRIRNMLGIPVRSNPMRYGRMTGPKVSVIIPAYNVQAYLQDAVASVQRQSHRNLEIVIVNDGSKDESGKIADEIARRDPRIRVIHKQNGGLGAARNTGLSATSGEYVTFVDSDDQLMPDAIELMLNSLEQTRSDFAIGAVERFNSTRTWTPDWVTEVHDVTRNNIQATDHPAVLWDVFVWNKLFRRSVWDSRVGLFPEGVLYEDQECTARLYVEGATFDCLPEKVYRWRFRDDGTSITQNKHSTEDLEDRLLVARTVRGVLQSSASPALLDTWYAKLLGDDLYWYFREVPRADHDFWEMLHNAVQEFSSEATQAALASIRFDRRLHLLAIAKRSREDFERVLFYFQEHGPSWQTRFLSNGTAVGHVEPLTEISPEFESQDLKIDLTSLRPDVTLFRQDHLDDGSVAFYGYVRVPNVQLTSRAAFEANIQTASNSSSGGEVRVIPVQIEQQTVPVANIHLRDPHNDHSNAGFRVTLSADVSSTLASLEAAGNGPEMRLKITVFDHGHEWASTSLALSQGGDLPRLSASHVNDTGNRMVFSLEQSELRISGAPVDFVVNEATLDGNCIDLVFRAKQPRDVEGLSAVLADDAHGVLSSSEIRVEGDVLRCQFVLPKSLPPIHSNYRGTEICLFSGEEFRGHLHVDATRSRVTSNGEFGLYPNRLGHLQVERYVQFGEARSVELLDDGRKVRISGFCRFSRSQVRQATPSFMLWRKDQTIYPALLEYQEQTGSFVCEFDLTRKDVDGSDVFYPMGGYLFGMLLATGKRLSPSFTLVTGADLSNGLPQTLRAGVSRVEVRRRARDSGLEIILASPFADDERGVFAQGQLVAGTRNLGRGQAPRPMVLLESFGGRSVGDSPKAIDAALALERPDLQRLWTVRDHTVAVPEGATAVVRYSREWYEAVATSQFLINNNNFPPFFRKREGQTYIQTWHGTPLKRVGNDVPPENLSLTYRRLMQRESEQYWDVLLAQTPWAGNILANAFKFEGRLFAAGYPRNDGLLQPNSDERRARVRRYLGLGDAQLAVLYAPTWRDNVKDAGGNYVRPDHLKSEDLRRRFGANAVLLVRGHANTASAASPRTGPGSIDVSAYPDINDLFLAADVLVTDYSSVQFDFVNTGKPIVYLAPDLSTYRDSVRGFYFDIEAAAPGPIVTTSGEVVEVLGDLDGLRSAYSQNYREFRKRFAGLDDGNSAQRFVADVFS